MTSAMNAFRQDDLRIAEQAAEWAGTLDTAGPQEQAAFIAWLRQSARHVEEFLLASALYRELDGIDSERRQDIDALLAAGATNVIALQPGGDALSAAAPATTLSKAPRIARPRHRYLKWGLAASIAAVALMPW